MQKPAQSSAERATRRVVLCGAVADHRGVLAAPGAVVLEGLRIVACGSPSQVGRIGEGAVESRPTQVVIPATVNAHAHLDLTAIGPRPFAGSFESWLDGVRRARLAMTADDVDASVAQGVRASLAAGVAAVGDIAGLHAEQPSLTWLRRAGLAGCSFVELFGLGTREAAAVDAIERRARATRGDATGQHPDWRMARQGVQPHAPYTAGPGVLRAALASGLPVSIHLAESPEETEFVSRGTGRLRALVDQLGVWCDATPFGARHPIDWAAGLLRECPGARLLAAHCNEVDDAALSILATAPIAVAYCPRASDYFGRSGHRYRDILKAGGVVALGTDSAICLDNQGIIGTLDEARHLMRRDRLDVAIALDMATVQGAKALGLPAHAFTLEPHAEPKAGVLAVDLGAAPRTPAEAAQMLSQSCSTPEWLAFTPDMAELLPEGCRGRYS